MATDLHPGHTDASVRPYRFVWHTLMRKVPQFMAMATFSQAVTKIGVPEHRPGEMPCVPVDPACTAHEP